MAGVGQQQFWIHKPSFIESNRGKKMLVYEDNFKYWFKLEYKAKMMLQSIEEKIPTPGPKILHVDFEIGVVKAWNEIFPEARI